MNLLAFCTSNWLNNEQAEARKPELQSWLSRVTRLFNPQGWFIACGSYSDPRLCPVGLHVVNSGVPYTKGYGNAWNYGCCAWSAALWHANFCHDWDVLVDVETDVYFSALDLNKLVRDFMASDALILAPAWCGCPDPNFAMFKREGILRFLHCRLRPNLDIYERKPSPMLGEDELRIIFNGKWSNPFSPTPIRQDFGHPGALTDAVAMTLPMVRLPSQPVKEHFLALEAKAIPFQP